MKGKKGFSPGISGNPAGKPVGCLNKTTGQLRELINRFLNENFETIMQDFQKLSPQQRIRSYVDLLQFALPKLQSIQQPDDIDRLTEDQVNELYERIITQVYDN
jgi:hypothetical protein